MMVDFKEKFKFLFEKIKKIKHIEIYLAVGLAVIIAIMYFTTLKSPENGTSTEDDNIDATFSSSQEYASYIENKLENVITTVKGAGKVNILITLEKGFEYIYVTEEETRTTSNGTIVTTATVVMVDGTPILQEEIYPVISGVVVIAEGAEDISVKMNIISIIQTVIDIDSSKINVIEGY